MIKRDEVPAELLAAVKNYLSITWDDEATDEKVRGFIASATVYLDKKGGGELDYDSDGLPRTLLFDYVRYQNSEALDIFENNFSALILAMQNDRLVSKYAEKNAVSG